MATVLTVLANYVDSTVTYRTTPADYLVMDLTNDYLIWTKGDSIVKDLMTHEPLTSELNAASESISATLAVIVTKCLFMDYSHNVGGAYYTHTVLGMGDNKRYVFGFSFDGATATEPQLEAWDTSAHLTANNHCLGAGTVANSMLRMVCTTSGLPGASWVGVPIANSTNVLLLNAGSGALGVLGGGILSQELYANIKIVIPAAYATPAAETFVITCRYNHF